MDIDIIRTIYKELFTVKFLHSGYGQASHNAFGNAIAIEPDAATKQLLAGYQADYRLLGNTLVCFIRSQLISPPAKEPKKPYTLFTGDTRLRFMLYGITDFFGKTYAVATGSKTVYQFTNKISNVQTGEKMLNKALASHTVVNNYDAGTIVKKGTQLYVSLQPVSAAANIQVTNTAFWKSIPFEQVVNNADLADTATVKPDKECFAVIDIHNSGMANNSYNLFGAGSRLMSPVYSIRFKSKV
ncbi:hypothetical protein [Foetidibacter luteolus]|uniref:hypothetical protein n=1 Tax=Foetidibacter luteolus TaxID=2608880 RepID=UPI00129A0F15|nr:hypothetical protein [Foetidibacter luteolus]